jgi:UDP-N-acetylmuramate--alanine ligase
VTRAAADVGAGLAPARPARPIIAGERIHVVGIAGAGASAAAILAAAVGGQVDGCDPGAPSPYSAALAARDIDVATRHDAGHLTDRTGRRVDRLAVTKALTAIAPDHPELVAARSAGIPLEPWQQLVADAAATNGQALIAVAGTHGKSTSTGWLLHVLAAAGRDPSGFVGALLPGTESEAPSTARIGRGDLCVVEADEYAGNFDAYRPALAVLLNAEWDHPDVFVDDAAVLDAFEGWIRAMPDQADRPTLVVNVGDPGAAAIAARLDDWPGRIVRVALEPDPTTDALDVTGRWTAAPGVGGGRLELGGPLTGPLSVDVTLDGRHNAADGLCVAAAAALLGLEGSAITGGLAGFPGVGRRLEQKGEPGGVLVYDDYGHHPAAIRSTMAAVRARHPGRPLWAVYEPLTFHRTAAMLDAFAEVLATADRAVIADIWAGRDTDRTVTSAEALASAISARAASPALAPGSVEQTADTLATLVQPGDVVLVMGGGRSYVIAERLVERLATGGTGRTAVAG